MLLFDLLAQYRGNNNGDLCAAWKLMQPRGWKSEEISHKAKLQLLDAGLMVETAKVRDPTRLACTL
jgi:hypothetical protein